MANGIQREMSKDYDALRDDVKQMREDFGSLISTLGKYRAKRMGEARDTAKSELEDMVDHLGEAYGQAKEQGLNYARRARLEVEEHPVTSVGISFGVGLVLGILFSRR